MPELAWYCQDIYKIWVEAYVRLSMLEDDGQREERERKCVRDGERVIKKESQEERQ